MTTMHETYGDRSDHAACPHCGLCVTCGDCHCDRISLTAADREFFVSAILDSAAPSERLRQAAAGYKADQLRQDVQEGLDSGPVTAWDPEEVKRAGRAAKGHPEHEALEAEAPSGYWNYRVVRRRHELEPDVLGIHEAYYSRTDDKPHSVTVEPVGVLGETIEGLREVLGKMGQALDKPILEYDEIGT